MAKRVFEIARELGVKSKAILEKCEAEGIPNMNNHMSSVSAGLEATIRDWFSEDGAAGSAVETAEHVDLSKVRAPARKKTKAKAKAKAKARPKAPEAEEAEEKDTSVAVAEPPATRAEPRVSRPAEKTEAESAPTREEPGETQAPARDAEAPAAPTPEQPSEPEAPARPGEPAEKTGSPETPADTRRAAAEESTKPGDEDKGGPEADAGPRARPNEPTRPSIIKPAGTRIEEEKKKPASLSGPRVVRVEAPDPVQAPRPRGGGGGGYAGPSRGAPPMPSDDDAGRSPRRNKRRSGPGGGGGPGGPGGPGGGRRGGRGVMPEKSRGGSWRQQDLIEREARLSRSGGFLRQRRREMKKRQEGGPVERAATPAETGGEVRIAEPFTIKDLSAATGVKASAIIKKLFMEGVAATVNSGISAEKAQEIMVDYDIDLVVEEARSAEDVVAQEFGEREVIDERPRAPVVTILGHVDHGKTSLLDKIRKANVAEGEAGGITQATSSFSVPVHAGDEQKQVVFIDTPGHEAFTSMRARGANMTDVVVLVVAADDGVMPQTIESINHAKAAGVPIVVALNKIDKPEATDSKIQQILAQLAEHELNPVEWGGSTEVVRTSAAKGDGIEELLETLDFQAQLLELKADFEGHAAGVVIESRQVEGRGAVANILVQNGQLKVGDFIVAGRAHGRVRDILDDQGKRIQEAGPSTPCQLSGLDVLPDAGDRFFVVDSLRKAQEAAEQRREREREKELVQPKVTLENMFSKMEEGKVAELLVVIKADVQGSVDVLRNTAEEIGVDEKDVRVRTLHAAVGGITESDVLLAEASGAVIIGFNVIPSAKARQLAEQKGVQIRTYDVIYDIVDDLKKAAAGLLEPEIRQEVLGHAEVREVFKISKVGAVAGCYVTDGSIERNAYIRVTRGDVVIENDRVLEQLKRFKDDAKEVRAGQECGMKIVGYDDIKAGDILECYRKVEVAREL